MIAFLKLAKAIPAVMPVTATAPTVEVVSIFESWTDLYFTLSWEPEESFFSILFLVFEFVEELGTQEETQLAEGAVEEVAEGA